MGHTSSGTSGSFRWREYVHGLRDQHGDWSGLAREFMGRCDELSDDVFRVSRGLRRLAERDQSSSNGMGSLLLRAFGLPSTIELWCRTLGQSHNPFSDFPIALRKQQLLCWDQAPVTRTPIAIWIHLGLASIAHDEGDTAELRRRITAAEEVPRPPIGARLELTLLKARVAVEETRWTDQLDSLACAQRILEGAHTQAEPDLQCYHAQWVEQHAWRIARGPTRRSDLWNARSLYASIPPDGPAFARSRRHAGLAWCSWRLGEQNAASEQAQTACSAAGDGGFFLLRVRALELRSRIERGTPLADRCLRRAQHLSQRLEEVGRFYRPSIHGLQARKNL